jgi:hypothetical protein
MNENRFYKESLPLLVSYFSGKSVELGSIETRIHQGGRDEFLLFENQLRARHVISIASSLLNSISETQERHSTKTVSSRSNSYGSIRGRLDTNKYINQKFQRKQYPPSYPVIVSVQSASTPENMFAKALLTLTLKKLLSISIPTQSAEFNKAKKIRRSLRDHLSMSPWSEIEIRGNLSRLFHESKRRINRRQTGNESSYSRLLLAYENLTLSMENISSIDVKNHFKDILVTFPDDKTFLDRIFEVWCLKKTFEAFEGVGLRCTQSNSLELRKNQPIFVFKYKSNPIEIWFQKQLPPSKSCWSYDVGEKNLRGIPDITVTCGQAYLVIDAKNRMITTNTRSEETYKILGYLENFQAILSSSNNWGLLIFTSKESFSRSLSSDDGKRILLTGAMVNDENSCDMHFQLMTYISEWLDGTPL